MWAADNAGDADLGSLSPVLLPGGWVFIAGKNGHGYVLHQGALGGHRRPGFVGLGLHRLRGRGLQR